MKTASAAKKTNASALYALIVVAALAGCAGMGQPRYEWTHPHGDQAQFQRDRAQCEYEATAATQATDYSYRSMFGQELDRAMRKTQLGEMCMSAKGYSKRPLASG